MVTRDGDVKDPGQVLKNAYREDANKAGSVAVQTIGSFVPESYDYISVTYPDTVTEVYVYRDGGASGTLIATVTITYSDASKEELLSVART